MKTLAASAGCRPRHGLNTVAIHQPVPLLQSLNQNFSGIFTRIFTVPNKYVRTFKILHYPDPFSVGNDQRLPQKTLIPHPYPIDIMSNHFSWRIDIMSNHIVAREFHHLCCKNSVIAPHSGDFRTRNYTLRLFLIYTTGYTHFPISLFLLLLLFYFRSVRRYAPAYRCRFYFYLTRMSSDQWYLLCTVTYVT